MNERMNVGVVERVLDDTRMGRQSRARLLKRAAVGVAGATALGGLGAGTAFASGGDSIQTVGVTAATAEALAVTYLHNVLERNERVHAFPRPVVEILRAAGTEELDHFKFLTGAGFKPLTTRFWLPDDFFGRKLANVPATIEVAETLFVNAYLIGITVFANAHQATLARYAGEILGVEAEHRALARSLQGKLPNTLPSSRSSTTTSPASSARWRRPASASASRAPSRGTSTRSAAWATCSSTSTTLSRCNPPQRCPLRGFPHLRGGLARCRRRRGRGAPGGDAARRPRRTAARFPGSPSSRPCTPPGGGSSVPCRARA